MTTATEPTPADRDPGRRTAAVSPRAAVARPGPERVSLRADTPAECIAALPALLGFVPRRSVVAMLLIEAPDRPGAVLLGTVAQHDVDVSDPDGWALLSAQLAGLGVRERAVAMLVVIVDDRSGPPDASRAEIPLKFVRLLEKALAAEYIALDEVWGVCEIAPGEPWWDVRSPATTGTQSDPDASPIASAGPHGDHPDDSAFWHEVCDELEMATALAANRFRAAVFRDEVRRYQSANLREILDCIESVEAGLPPAPRDIARTAVALRDPAVRDAVFGLAGGESAGAAERLWEHLCRTLSGPDRAEAAVLLGYSAFARGDRSVASSALHIALQSNPEHTIARLLDTALGIGMSPEEIRKLARSGRATAAELGVELAPPPDWPRL